MPVPLRRSTVQAKEFPWPRPASFRSPPAAQPHCCSLSNLFTTPLATGVPSTGATSRRSRCRRSTRFGAIGAYTVRSSLFDVAMMMVFDVVGDLFKKLKYPLAPLVLALVLGDIAEASFRQSMRLSQGSLAIFRANPLVGSLTGLALLMRVWPLIGRVKDSMRGAQARRLKTGN
jgi:hypothetical protein